MNKIAKKRVSKIKNQKEVHDYRDFIKSPNVSTDDTVIISNANLIGSNVLHNEVSLEDSKKKPAPPPVPVVFGKWVREHLIEIVVCLIVIPFCWWTLTSIFELQSHVDVTKEKFEGIKQSIEKLQTDSVTREILKFQIEALELEIKSNMKISYSELNARLNTIEKQIDKIENLNNQLSKP